MSDFLDRIRPRCLAQTGYEGEGRGSEGREGTRSGRTSGKKPSPAAASDGARDFWHSRDVGIDGDEFRTYTAGYENPVTLYILHHGAGDTSPCWTLTAKMLLEQFSVGDRVQILAFDMRGHGASRATDEEDLGLERLVRDLEQIAKVFTGGTELRHVILVGHSLGGAVVVRASMMKVVPRVKGVVVMDVVEGTALASLRDMRRILMSRPASFKTIEEAISWSTQSQTIRNPASAALSIPSRLTQTPPSTSYHWRANLLTTERFWRTWFADLSSTFLSVPAAKLLLIASTDRLDKTLTIAHMQGKLQVTVFNDCGHQIMEDLPGETAVALYGFWERNCNTLIPKSAKWRELEGEN